MNIEDIIPEEKDIKRALGLSKNGHFPLSGKASGMAKLITDRTKLVRRSKAVAAIWGIMDKEGHNAWDPFANALSKAGFTMEDITAISKFSVNHESVDPMLIVGLEEL